MTKADIAEHLAETMQRHGTRMSFRQASTAVAAVLDQMTLALKGGEKVVIRNFGTFCTKYKPGRPGRNPKTGAPATIHPRQVVTFKPGVEFRSAVNTGTVI